MKIYLISQDEFDGYDTYDSAVVVAADARKARQIHPGGAMWANRNVPYNDWRDGDAWATSPETVEARMVGYAKRGMKEGDVICASFNAG